MPRRNEKQRLCRSPSIRQWVLGKRLKSNNCKLGECDLQGGGVSGGGGMVSGGGNGLLKLMEPETMMKVARLIN